MQWSEASCKQRRSVGALRREWLLQRVEATPLPETWLFHHRWAKMTTGSIASPIGRIHFDTIGGRTTAFLPDVQKKTGGRPAAKPSAKPASKKKRVSAAKTPSAAAKKRRTSPRSLSK